MYTSLSKIGNRCRIRSGSGPADLGLSGIVRKMIPEMRSTETFSPTRFADLNEVLDDLLERVQAILGANFCGAYLQGSFAIGDADEYSDVDFIVVTHDEITEVQLDGLQEMHRRLYALDSPWAQHLEGSYVPKNALRHVDESRASYWYLDNGASELIRDRHCNTAIVRWTLRERGVVLAGPSPKSLVEPVTAEQLRQDVLRDLPGWRAWAPEPTKAGGMSRWKQPYLVVNSCRMLHTFETGRVGSKRDAGEWALRVLDPEWADLVRQALDDRRDPWVRVYEPADPDTIQRTLAFVDYVVRRAR
jgi:hypothetical protein